MSTAYSHVSYPRLLHNLRKRGSGWENCRMNNKLRARDRTITIQLWKYTSQSVDVNISIPQDFCLSSILYLFYSTHNLEEASHDISWTAIRGWMDDTYFLLAHSKFTEENCRKLALMHRKAERWFTTHDLKFDLDKYKLIHLTRYCMGNPV